METLQKKDCSWKEKDGVIYFSVVSDGTTGTEWINRLKRAGYRVGEYAKKVFLSSDFKPTNGVITEIAILKGSFLKKNRTTQEIMIEAEKHNFFELKAEIVGLMREKFSDEEIKMMGISSIVTIFKPFKFKGEVDSINFLRFGNSNGIIAYYDNHDNSWMTDYGFAFEV